ncbi:alcohol dehydrogenase-like [Glandiceps talaboti]
MSEMKTMKCVKLVKHHPEPLQFIPDEKFPDLPPEGAIIKVSFCGVCHSDAHLWRIASKDNFPFTLGHEISGTIHSIGQSASPGGLKTGDEVIVYPWIGCGKCNNCLGGDFTYCSVHEDPENSVEIGCTVDGGFAEYVAISNMRFVLSLPTPIDKATSGMLGCGMLTAYSATKRAMEYSQEILLNKDKCGILVIGAGGLGLSAIRVLNALLLSKNDRVELACADINESKMSHVIENGCDNFIHWPIGASPEDIVLKTKSAFSESGPHIVLDFVGNEATFNAAFYSLAKHGLQVNIGLACPPAKIPLWPLVSRCLRIEGLYAGSLQTMKDLVDLVEKKVITPLSQYSLHKLEDTQAIIEKLKRGEITGRAIISFE